MLPKWLVRFGVGGLGLVKVVKLTNFHEFLSKSRSFTMVSLYQCNASIEAAAPGMLDKYSLQANMETCTWICPTPAGDQISLRKLKKNLKNGATKILVSKVTEFHLKNPSRPLSDAQFHPQVSAASLWPNYDVPLAGPRPSTFGSTPNIPQGPQNTCRPSKFPHSALIFKSGHDVPNHFNTVGSACLTPLSGEALVKIGLPWF
ncbi:hypothetical protein C8F04DRAFT_1192896 [Mycena alexandri]|uniref:Uncharacterized protein n=1 Tax=Mycena alexandri TaxID=1745969 RepID=A0AAD6SBI4_9AGAR|nr:hypothetical protein C8F04DRAFT_1192896 [Mycena alexandri]